MKSYSLISIVALTASTVSAVPPENFGFPTSETASPLSVIYQANGSSLTYQPGELFGIDVPAQMPQIAVNESESLIRDYNGSYLLLMVDPDASYPENPTSRFILHWFAPGWKKSMSQSTSASMGGTLLENSTAAIAEYRRPAPPVNSSAHRYIQYLFAEPANFQVPAAFSGFNSMNRTKFPLEQFISAAGLNSPVAANYFYCSNETVVPVNFVAPPGSQYPGGNGAMVTQGTNEPSATMTASSSGSATASATGSASPSSYSGSAVADRVARMENVGLGFVASIFASWLLTV